MATKLSKSSAKKVSGGKSTSAVAKAKGKKPLVTTSYVNAAGGSLGAPNKVKLAKGSLSTKSGAGPWPSLGLQTKLSGKSSAKKSEL